MKKNICTLIAIIGIKSVIAQPELNSWKMNNNEQTATYWTNTGSANNPTFVFNTSTAKADVTQICYNTSYVWVKSEGMTLNMGKFLNPGSPSAQNYIFKIPRTSTVATNNITSPLGGPIGVLTNGIPMFGLGSSKYYNGSGNNGNGIGTWNVEVYLAEGFVLDTAFGAHPQQQGAYHTHAKPNRLYATTPSTIHSPIIGYAYDGYPVYGPNGYSTATLAASAVTRMTTGYSLRSITTRTSLPYGGTLTVANYGPAVNSTYPLGTYIEDYEWLASNNGSLDKYNGRFCVTPEYPSGTYAYFVTNNASGTPEFPYIIGTQYYGVPDLTNAAGSSTVAIPGGTSCFTTQTTAIKKNENDYAISTFPNPSSGKFNISLPNLKGLTTIEIYSIDGKLIFFESEDKNLFSVDVSNQELGGIFILKITNDGRVYQSKLVLQD